MEPSRPPDIPFGKRGPAPITTGSPHPTAKPPVLSRAPSDDDAFIPPLRSLAVTVGVAALLTFGAFALAEGVHEWSCRPNEPKPPADPNAPVDPNAPRPSCNNGSSHSYWHRSSRGGGGWGGWGGGSSGGSTSTGVSFGGFGHSAGSHGGGGE